MRKLFSKAVLTLATALLLLPARAQAAEEDDVVMLANGGRMRGTVIEEDPQKGVRIKLLDGTFRTLKPAEVREVHYHGESSAPAAPVAAPAAAAAPAAPPSVISAEGATPAPLAPVAPPPAPFPAAPPMYYYAPPPPPPSDASYDPGHKFELGMRFGFAVPMGGFTGGTPGGGDASLSQTFAVKIPILFELGYELGDGFVLGVHAQYGFIVDKTGDGTPCPDSVSCSDHDVEIGIDALYHFQLGQRVDPWLGAGFGYEFESESITYMGSNLDYSLKGPQYLKLQGGVDFKTGSNMTVGPFVSFSVSEYTKASSGGQSVDIDPTATHEWLNLGVKGTFRVGG